MSHDLIIRNGTVVDGSGQSRFSGDIAIDDGLISRIGNISESAYEEIDATDKIVPGVRRRAHAHGRAGLLGAVRHLLVLPRCD